MVVDEDPVALSTSTLAVLREFLAERDSAAVDASSDPFAEDWSKSQFWYTEDTATRVADEATRAARGGSIACVACPSLFRALRARHPQQPAHLFEFDRRFEVLGNFSFYDYNDPCRIDEPLRGAFSVIVLDPPYLSEECLTKTIETARLLGRKDAKPAYLALTGGTMRRTALALLDLRPTCWRPEHQNKLGNEFCLYAGDEELAAAFGGWEATA